MVKDRKRRTYFTMRSYELR